MAQETASNFPGIFTVQGNADRWGLEGKDAVLIDLASGRAQTAVEGLRAQVTSDNILREGQDNIRATMQAACDTQREILISRFEAKENTRILQEQVRVDGDKTRDMIRAQDTTRLLDMIAELRARVAALTPVVLPTPVTPSGG